MMLSMQQTEVLYSINIYIYISIIILVFKLYILLLISGGRWYGGACHIHNGELLCSAHGT
jgi:Zn-dependent peptidase ImmA (M78 family)